MNDAPITVGFAVGPVGAAAIDAPGRRPVFERMILEGIELPEFLAGRAVERHETEISRRDVHHTADHDRRALDGLSFTTLEFSRVVRPDRLEPGHVPTADLFQFGISHATVIIPHAAASQP